jgi:hypothetical protein
VNTRERHERRPVRRRDRQQYTGGRIPTELALGSDGRLYVNAEGVDAQRMMGREMFVGHALTSGELRHLGPHGLLLIALQRSGGRVALASDGRVYIEDATAAPHKHRHRALFRGFAMNEEEMPLAVEEIHRMAFNVTVGVQLALRERRKLRRAA